MPSANADVAVKQYEQLAIRSRVNEASPHRLIQLMMQRVLEKIALARTQIVQGRVHDKGNNISDAIGIIDGLQASLNHDADRRMSENFDALYNYMSRQLLAANLHNDEARLVEVAGLMRELKEAWDAIAGEVEGR